MTEVKFVDLGRQYLNLREEILAAFDRISRTGNYVLNEDVDKFETAFAAYCGVQHAVSMGNGSDPLHLPLLPPPPRRASRPHPLLTNPGGSATPLRSRRNGFRAAPKGQTSSRATSSPGSSGGPTGTRPSSMTVWSGSAIRWMGRVLSGSPRRESR